MQNFNVLVAITHPQYTWDVATGDVHGSNLSTSNLLN